MDHSDRSIGHSASCLVNPDRSDVALHLGRYSREISAHELILSLEKNTHGLNNVNSVNKQAESFMYNLRRLENYLDGSFVNKNYGQLSSCQVFTYSSTVTRNQRLMTGHICEAEVEVRKTK